MLIHNMINTVINISNYWRNLGVYGRKLVIFKRLPENRKNLHHINEQTNYRNKRYEKFPFYEDLADLLSLKNPYTDLTLLEDRNAIINLVPLLTNFHMRLHGGRRKVSTIETAFGNFDSKQLISFFTILNLSDNYKGINDFLESYIDFDTNVRILEIKWELDIAARMSSYLIYKYPELYRVWCYYVYGVDINDQKEM